MTKKGIRVVIPVNIQQKLALAGKIYDKDTADGANSPLKALVDHDWTTTGPKVPTCLELHNKGEEYRRLMEEAYRDRDALLVEIDGIIKSSRDLLLGVYGKTPKKLGEWGFTVDDSPHSKPQQPTA
jgi:hypothetical protein